MSKIRKRPSCCTHPYCQGGECGKCGYNPRSGYAPFHFDMGGKAHNGKTPVLLPVSLALFVGVVAGVVGSIDCNGPYDYAGLLRGALFVVVGAFVSMKVIMRSVKI